VGLKRDFLGARLDLEKFARAMEKSPMSEQKNRPRARKSHLAVMLGSLAAGSAATVTALDSWDKVLEEFGFKKSEAVMLAEQGEQGDLLRQMMQMIDRRVFWTARYSGELTDGFPQADQDEAWKQYNDSIIAWNQNYMLNTMLTERYFSAESKAQLIDLNWLLHRVNSCLNKIHYHEIYQKKDPACHFDNADGGTDQDNLRVLNDALKQVSTKVGALVSSLSH
jgi:hypothetical protein